MLRRPRTTRAAAPLLVLVLMSACSGGGDDDARATVTTARPATTTTLAPSTSTTAPFDIFSLRPPPPAGDPAGLAAQITAAEAVLADPAAGEVDVATAALAQQIAYRQLGDHPEWDDAVLAALPADLRPVAAIHGGTRREFRGLGKPREALPEWRIVAPAPLAELEAHYKAAAAEFGLAWEYLAAIHLVETATGRIRGTSVAGAQGPMQFLPATWEAYGGGGDINDTRDAVRGAARYLKANRGDVDMPNALWNYNHSERYVRGVTSYAHLIHTNPLTLRAMYHWGVWYRLTTGDVYLPVGYGT